MSDSAAQGGEEPSEGIAGKGYHSRAVLKALTGIFRSLISEPGRHGRLQWRGDTAARDAVYANRKRLGFSKGKALMRALFGVGRPKGWVDARLEALLAYFVGRICCVLAIWPTSGVRKAMCPMIIRFELTV